MSDKRKFMHASAIYGLSQILMLSVSLISFPILTRMLSVSEYGVLGLCSTTLLFGSAFAKGGLQNSIIRFYARYRKEGILDNFYATTWWGGVGVAIISSLLLLPIAIVIAPNSFEPAFVSVVLVVFSSALFSNVTNFLRAEERNTAFSVASIVVRYVGTFGGIGLVYFYNTGISGIFYAQFIAMMIMTIWYFRSFQRQHGILPQQFSMSIFRESFSFGAPLIIFELSSIALAFSDRFLVSKFCGTEQLGIYTAGYTISFYIADIVRQPLQMAVNPIYLRIYAEKGLEEAILFIQDAIGYVALVILPIFAGCTAIKTDLMVMLASSKYAAASDIIPWVLGSTLIFGCQSIVAPSFAILKQSKASAGIAIISALLNILMNVLMLPKYGIIAAAWSTAASYLFMIFVVLLISQQKIKLKYPLWKIVKYTLSSIVMYSVIQYLTVSLSIKIVVGAFTYCVITLLLDRKLLVEVRQFVSTLQSKQRVTA